MVLVVDCHRYPSVAIVFSMAEMNAGVKGTEQAKGSRRWTSSPTKNYDIEESMNRVRVI